MPASSPDPRHPRGSAPTLAVVVPATDSPPALERCLAALEAGSRTPDELVVQREPAGAGPAAARNLGAAASRGGRPRLRRLRRRGPPRRAGADRSALRRRPRPDRRSSAPTTTTPPTPACTSRYRNLLHHHVHAGARRARRRPSGPAWGRSGARRSRPRAASTPTRSPTPSVEDIELGMRLRRARRADRPRPGDPRPPPQGLDPAEHGRDRLRAGAGFPGRGCCCATAGDSTRAQPRLAPPRQRRAPASRCSGRCWPAARGWPRRRSLANLVLDRDLYALLARRGGPRLLLAGIGLHQLHQLSAAASVPAALVLHARGGATR